MLTVALLLLAAYAAPQASAENIELFKIDILDDTHADASYIEPGFIGWAPKVASGEYPPPTETTVSTPIGDVTISFDVGLKQQDRFRTMPAGTPGVNMYQDSFWGRSADFNDQGIDITISGLDPGQSYLVALYAYDYNDWNGLVSADWTANGEEAFTASWYAEDDGGEEIDLPTSLDTFKHTVVVEADANGKILMVSSPGEGTNRDSYWANCSGLELYQIPEPGTTICLLSLISCVLFVRRR
jgi:hypothetical protein